MIVLAVLPSTALGGGIERYSEAVLTSLTKRGMTVIRIALNRGTGARLARKLGFILELRSAVRRIPAGQPATVLVFHPALALATSGVIRLARTNRATIAVVFHGQETWGLSALERWVIRHSQHRLIAVSSFTAGTVATLGPTRILSPGFCPVWYSLLLSAPCPQPAAANASHLLSVFRFDVSEIKGAYTLLETGDRLLTKGFPISLRLAGTGAVPDRLRQEVAKRGSWAELVVSPVDEELALLYQWADLFVLATRTSAVKPLSGEGFGIVLAEAQLSGVPVVAPAGGGSSSAYVDGLTGVAPVDESVDSLEAVLEKLLSDPVTLARMSSNARAWARDRFEPADYADRVMSVLFDEPAFRCPAQVIRPAGEPPSRSRQ